MDLDCHSWSSVQDTEETCEFIIDFENLEQ